MATKSPTQFHNHWGAYANAAALPNSTAEPALEAGDLAYAIAEANTYTCTNPAAGTWVSGGGGGAPQSNVWLGGAYTYTQAAQPVEEVTGNNGFDASSVGALTAYFLASVTNSWQQPGGSETVRVRLYDMGPALGPPDVTPRLVSELTDTLQGGPRGLVQALTVVSSTPGTNQILDSARAYEVAIIHDPSTQGDVTYLGSVSLEVR